jgi:alkylhydroperoxidase family enzyme
LAKQLGASQDLLDAMFNIDQHRDEFSAAELAALTLAERMTTDARNVDEEVWAELRAHYDDGQIIELASVIGLFNYFNRFNDALRVEITPPGRPSASGASE